MGDATVSISRTSEENFKALVHFGKLDNKEVYGSLVETLSFALISIQSQRRTNEERKKECE